MGIARRYSVGVYFLVAYAATWAVWLPRALADQGLLDWGWPALVGQVWAYGPALAAVAVAAAAAGKERTRRLRRMLERWRIGWRWWAAVLLGPFVVSWGTLALYEVVSGLPAPWPVGHPAELLVFPLLLLILALTDGIGEEVGWRGFALPRLQRWAKPALASMLLGVVWAVWNLPLFWTDGASLEGRSFALLLLSLLPTSILFTWVFNRSGGSLPAAIALHAALNLAGPVVPQAEEGVFTPFLLTVRVKWAIAAVVLISDRSLGARTAGAIQQELIPNPPEHVADRAPSRSSAPPLAQ